MDVLIDASALMAVLVNGPEKDHIVNLTKNCNLLAPTMLPHEIGNLLMRLKKQQVLNNQEIIAIYDDFKKILLRLLNVDVEGALIIACKYRIYAYDAYYLEAASRLKLPIITLDRKMKKIASNLNIQIL
jgi:predicted nucleic acid-binding protein